MALVRAALFMRPSPAMESWDAVETVARIREGDVSATEVLEATIQPHATISATGWADLPDAERLVQRLVAQQLPTGTRPVAFVYPALLRSVD